MPKKFQRPSGAYAGQAGLTNRSKYQEDATATPKRAISSAKVDGDINYVIDAVNETWDVMVNESFTSALPDQAGNAGKVTVTNGTTAAWQLVTGTNVQARSLPLDRLEDVGTGKLLGAGDTGAVTAVSLGAGLSLSGGTLVADGGGLPVGAIAPFASAVTPVGWLMCNGQTVSRTTYAGLFAVIGTIYGAGDGSTTFAVPDLRGRVALGMDNMGGAADSGRLNVTNTIGGSGGSQLKSFTTAATVLTVDQIPSHKHTLLGRNSAGAIASGTGLLAGSNAIVSSVGQSTDVTDAMSSTGGGQGHNHSVSNLDTLPPFLLLNYIIKC